MRIRTVVVAATIATALAAPTAHAVPQCPTIVDPSGDTGFFVPIRDDQADVTAVNVSTSKSKLTATITVLGQPVATDPVWLRYYEVYFRTGEENYVLRATLGGNQSSYQLVLNTQGAEAGGNTVNEWVVLKTVEGRTGSHTVTITAPLDRELPLLGQSVYVFGRTWIATNNVGGTPFLLAEATLDETAGAGYDVGDRGCP